MVRKKKNHCISKQSAALKIPSARCRPAATTVRDDCTPTSTPTLPSAAQKAFPRARESGGCVHAGRCGALGEDIAAHVQKFPSMAAQLLRSNSLIG